MLAALRSRGSGHYTVRELAARTGFSVGQVHRTLRTLAAAGVIAWVRAPRRGSTITLREKCGPDRNVHSPKTPQIQIKEKKNGHSGPLASQLPLTGPLASQLPLGRKALAWALAQVRNDLRARPSISPDRRAVIMACLGPEIHKLIKRGEIRRRGELTRVVDFVLARLDERRGLGCDYGATKRWAVWCVQLARRALQVAREEEERSRAFLQREAEAMAEARKAWAEGPTVGQLAHTLPRKEVQRERTLQELVPDIEERRKRALQALEAGGRTLQELVPDIEERRKRALQALEAGGRTCT